MVKMAVELRLRYPYEEFADHLRAMKTVREWQYTSRFGHLGKLQTSMANSARTVEYFSDSYPDQKEAVRKAEVFLSINDYIARHAALFCRKDLMEELETSAKVFGRLWSFKTKSLVDAADILARAQCVQLLRADRQPDPRWPGSASRLRPTRGPLCRWSRGRSIQDFR